MSFDFGSHRRLTLRMPREAFRPSLLFLGLVALCVTGGVLAWQGWGSLGIDVFVFVVAGWLVTLCLHEYAHALVAYRYGDTGVAARGYLTLNPLKYSHPVLSIVLPIVFLLIGGFGLPGGAVFVDRHAIRGRLADSLVSAAGPAVNVFFTLVLVAPFALGVEMAGHIGFWAGWAFLAFLQLTASVLNLLPLPGMDGGNLLQPWLSPQWQRGYAVVAPYGMLIFFALLLEPRINGWFFSAIFALADLIGLPSAYYFAGLDLVRFWS